MTLLGMTESQRERAELLKLMIKRTEEQQRFLQSQGVPHIISRFGEVPRFPEMPQFSTYLVMPTVPGREKK